jgi:hypothetical protein
MSAIKHGTLSGYNHGGCRDQCCRRAHTRSVTLWRMGRSDALVPIVGTRRRIRALMRLGWTAQHIATECGWEHRNAVLDLITPGRREQTTLTSTRDRVAAAYDRLSMQIGPSSRTRNRAERADWLPPLAYDDDRIDDPDYSPLEAMSYVPKKYEVDEAVVLRVLAGETLPTTRAEKLEITRRWVASGRSSKSLAHRMGWKEGRYSGGSVGAQAHSASGSQTTDRKAS